MPFNLLFSPTIANFSKNASEYSSKYLGIYLLLIGLLVLMHENFILQNDSNAVKVFSETTNQLIDSFSDVMKGARPNAIGGGIIGCTFGVLFMLLFS